MGSGDEVGAARERANKILMKVSQEIRIKNRAVVEVVRFQFVTAEISTIRVHGLRGHGGRG